MACPWWPCFVWIKLVLAASVEGYIVTIYVRFLVILPIISEANLLKVS